MNILRSVKELKAWRELTKGTVGIVPTMGNLHQGHISLVNASKSENSHTLVSVFVNPTQFNNANDFENYPKTLEDDATLLKSVGVDVLFAPSAKEMYPQGFSHKVSRTSDSRILCDAHREGHFDGVLTVVAKLLLLARADRAYFGEKDFQQLRYIQEMVSDLFINTEVIGCPTCRETSGLAMSSRNGRLTDAGKQKAAKVFQWIFRDQLKLDELAKSMQQNGIELEYFEEHWGRKFVAFWVEGVRLIDNAPGTEQNSGGLLVKERP